MLQDKRHFNALKTSLKTVGASREDWKLTKFCTLGISLFKIEGKFWGEDMIAKQLSKTHKKSFFKGYKMQPWAKFYLFYKLRYVINCCFASDEKPCKCNFLFEVFFILSKSFVFIVFCYWLASHLTWFCNRLFLFLRDYRETDECTVGIFTLVSDFKLTQYLNLTLSANNLDTEMCQYLGCLLALWTSDGGHFACICRICSFQYALGLQWFRKYWATLI